MASSKGSITSERCGKSRLGAATSADAIDVEEEDKRVFATDLRVSLPSGTTPKMPEVDKTLNWPMLEMRFIIHLKKYPNFVEILNEPIGKEEGDVSAQKEKYGHKVDQVYSLITDMCDLNVTAMNIVQTHYQSDLHLWPNTLWKMLLTFKYWNHQLLDQEPTDSSAFDYIGLNYAVGNCKWSKYRSIATVITTALLAEELYRNRGPTRNSFKRAKQRKRKREKLGRPFHANTALLAPQLNTQIFMHLLRSI